MTKVLYIPADNISANFSRSYHIAKNLSNHCELYRVMWEDNRSAFWSGKKVSGLNGLMCFLKSYLQKNRIIVSQDFGYEVYTSVVISAFIGRVIGKYKALKWMRKRNGKTLSKLIKNINPDVIFHADGYYFFPAHGGGIPEFSDVQDDINWSNIPKENLREARLYYENQFNQSIINYIVSPSAKQSLNEHLKCDFTPISNGADFNQIGGISQKQVSDFKSRFNIPDHAKIASYIGGEHKFDLAFTKKLTTLAQTELPEIMFVLAGNLPTYDAANVIFTGIISNDDANTLYASSTVGLTLKNTLNNDFIYNSVPLKFLQYAAAKKPIVSFPIKWSVDEAFENIQHIDSEDIQSWISAIQTASTSFKWNEALNERWNQYDWKNIGERIYKSLIAKS